MRICIVSSYFYPHKGGSQKYAEELSVALRRLDPTIEIDVICYNTDHSPAVENYRGLTIYRVPCIQILPGQFALPNYWSLWQLVKKMGQEEKYDVVNSHTRFFDNSWWTPLLAKYWHAKSILTDHCADFPTHRNKLVTQIARIIDHLISPVIARWYKVITVTNMATYQFDHQLFHRQPVLIYGGVDTSFFSKKNTKAEPKKDIVISFIGRMIQSKGPQLLFAAAHKIHEAHPNVQFVFAGSGEEYEQLKSRSTSYIHFLGSLEKDEIRDLLKKTDIVVHPSVHHEGFPNVLLEAGAAEAAVLATPMGGTKEIILNNKTGLLIEASVESITQNVVRLLNDPEKRKKLGHNLRTHIQAQFEWSAIAQRYRELLLQLTV